MGTASAKLKTPELRVVLQTLIGTDWTRRGSSAEL